MDQFARMDWLIYKAGLSNLIRILFSTKEGLDYTESKRNATTNALDLKFEEFLSLIATIQK